MKPRRKLRALAVTVGAIGALAALSASPAMAEIVTTQFNASTAKLSGTGLTVKKNGGEAKTCELKAVTGKTQVNGKLEVYSQFWPTFQTILDCTGGTKLWISMMATGRYDTVTGAYSLKMNYTFPGGAYVSPWGQYRIGYSGKELIAGWTNGSGATSSTINFNETYLGKHEPALTEDITLSGTITATTSTGGLLTLSH